MYLWPFCLAYGSPMRPPGVSIPRSIRSKRASIGELPEAVREEALACVQTARHALHA
jgi:hypothetical protein